MLLKILAFFYFKGDKDGFVIVDEPLFFVNKTKSRNSSNDNPPITGTGMEQFSCYQTIL